MTSTLPRLAVFEAIAGHDPNSTAVVHSVSGRTFRYGRLLADVRTTRNRLCERAKTTDLNGERVAFLVENSYDYVVTLLAILAARAIAVPLSPAFPAVELQYILNHSEAGILLSSSKFADKAREVLKTELDRPPVFAQLDKFTGSDDDHGANSPESVPLEVKQDTGSAAIMLYTSGTTNRPKGVLSPASVMKAQALSLKVAWEYAPCDRLLHILPLNHIHGIINAILAPLFAGSSIEFLFPFNADAVWHRLSAPFLPPNHKAKRTGGKAIITFLTAVPTVYSRLLTSHKSLDSDTQTAARTAISPRHLRLCISGSAALPTPTKRAWFDLSGGNALLERYGMTEVGMALSCGLAPSDRVDGSVGWPLPGVEARLVDIDSQHVIEHGREIDPDTGRERAGEIQLRGPTVFLEYWRDAPATAREFVLDEKNPASAPWFKTGDVAVRRAVPGAGGTSQAGWACGPLYFVLGRRSADIIKSGGEKVSALEVEREMLALPCVAEVAVLAVASGKWGEKVGAVVVLEGRERWTALEMRRALKGRLVAYKIPQVLRVVDSIPRNAMGKVNKRQLATTLFADEASGDEV